jgi:PAS domain S-box-containing protein
MDILTLLPPIFYAITTLFWIFLIIISFKRFKHYRQEQPLFSKLSIIVSFFASTAAAGNILFIYQYLSTPHTEAMMWVDWAILALNTTAAIVTSTLFTHQSISDSVTNIIHKIDVLDELNGEKEELLDIIDEKEEFINLQKVLIDINQIMINSINPNKMLDKICHQLCEYPSFNVAWIGFAEYNAYELPISFFHDSAEPRFLSNDFVSLLDHNEPYANGPSSQAMLTCKSVVIEDTQSDLRFSQWHTRAKFSQIKSVLSFPMIAKDGDKPIGVLTIYSQKSLTSQSPIVDIMEKTVHAITAYIARLNNQIKLENLRQKNFNELNNIKSVLDAIPESIFWKDRELRYLGANKRFLEFENIDSLSDILGKTNEEINWSYPKSEDSAVENKILATNRDSLKNIEQINNRYCTSNKLRFYDSNKTLLGLIGIRSEITDEYNNQLEHKRNEKLYHDILDSIPGLAIQYFGSDRRIVKWNIHNVLMFGYSKEEAVGKKVEELLYPKELRNEFIHKIDSWLTLNRPLQPMKMRLLTKDGKGVTVLGSYVLQNRRSKNPLFISVYIKS